MINWNIKTKILVGDNREVLVQQKSKNNIDELEVSKVVDNGEHSLYLIRIRSLFGHNADMYSMSQTEMKEFLI